ncbi:MAG TPA: metallophosphoesterase [Chitinophagaceae bacterium]|nr:metallophosphoesterase [Chitinophagaceae bacterium]
MRQSPFWWILIGFMILLDLYVFQALRVITQPAGHRTRLIIHAGYWLLSVGAIVMLLILPYLHFHNQARFIRTTIFALLAGLFFAKITASIFFVVDDARRGVKWAAGKLRKAKPTAIEDDSEKISRSLFLSWTGMLVGGGVLGSLIWGFGNKYRYRVRRQQLSFTNLPDSFRGLRIAQISDIHAGSFNDRESVLRGVLKIQELQPDLILFTGDLVNNIADEMDDYAEVFARLRAPMGVYSVLGNHDYGDYVSWTSRSEKEKNLERLKQVHAAMGWRLLLNEHVVLEKGSDKIALLGIENWSAKARFPKYGDLQQAHRGTENFPFKILLSHDPSHWKAEVCRLYPDVDLMLSGHTHGMQFGVEIPGLKWSPVQYVYREWAGLYENANQRLYVNRGFGFIGYPGRVGILPEITLLELV